MRKLGFFACLAFVSSWAALAQAPAAPEERWPRELDSGGNHFVIYQPQVDSWKNDHLEARSAVMVTQPGQPRPAYGIVSLSARTEVDKEARMVTLEDLKVTGATFPAAASRQSYLADMIRKSLPDWPRTVSLDRLLADLTITHSRNQCRIRAAQERTAANYLQQRAFGAHIDRWRAGVQARTMNAVYAGHQHAGPAIVRCGRESFLPGWREMVDDRNLAERPLGCRYGAAGRSGTSQSRPARGRRERSSRSPSGPATESSSQGLCEHSSGGIDRDQR